MDDRRHADSHFFVDRSPTRLSPRDSRPCCSGKFALYGIPVVRSACASTRLIPIAIAVTLGIALSIPLSASASSASAPPNIAMQKRAAPPSQGGAPVGLLVKRKYISDEDDDLLLHEPVVDFGLYYGPRIQFTVPLPARVQISSGSNNTKSEI